MRTNLFSAALALALTLTAACAQADGFTGCPAPLTQVEADQALRIVRGRLPSTRILAAKPGPAGTCLVDLLLGDGQTVYADISGHYFIYGALFDLTTGQQLNGAADVSIKKEVR